MKKTKFAILGDSYSTFRGLIPEGYAAWYGPEGRNGITCSEETWWVQALSELDGELVINSSYSGSTVCYSGYNGENFKRCAFITRMRKDLPAQVRANVIIEFGATNDFWVPAPIGEIKYSGWREEDFVSFAPSYAYMLDYLKKTHPGTLIVHLANDDVTGRVRDVVREVTAHYGVPNIELTNISKRDGHPDVTGMQQIARQFVDWYKENGIK